MDKKFEFYKEVYFFEHNRKNSVLNAHGIPVGILTILLGVIGFYIDDLIKEQLPFDWLFFTFSLFLVASIIAIIISFVILVRSYTGHQYEYIPILDKIREFEKSNDAYYQNKKQQADEDFFNHLKDAVVNAASRNYLSNRQRATLLFKANRILIFACILSALSAVPYFSSKALQKKDPPIHNVKLVNFKPKPSNQERMSDNKKTPKNNPQKSEPKQEAPKKIAKPVFPTNEVIIEGKMTPKEIQRITMSKKDGSGSKSTSKSNSKKKD